jgi:N-acetylneuraminate synthase
MGSEKIVHEKEEQIKSWAFRSIVALRDIKEKEVITKDMIWSKRPGTGIPSKKMPEIIGKVAKKSIKANTLLKWEDLED